MKTNKNVPFAWNPTSILKMKKAAISTQVIAPLAVLFPTFCSYAAFTTPTMAGFCLFLYHNKAASPTD